MIAQAAQPARRPEFEVFDDSWPVFCLFALAPWRSSVWDGTWLGLDWPSAESLARGLEVPWNAVTIGDLRAMEGAALAMLTARRR